MKTATANQFKIGPHIRTEKSTKSIMMDVAIALVPAFLGSIYFFGLRALTIVLVAVLTCMASEFLWQSIRKEQITVFDFSAIVTGMLLAFNLPSTTPLWVVIAASVFAIIIAKHFFGGLGSNFANPALMGRLFIMILWPGQMMQYVAPAFQKADAVTSATVLSMAKNTGEIIGYSYWDMFIGNIPGAIGETSKLLLLIGFLYLCYKQIVNIKIALVYIGTVVGMTFVFGGTTLFTGDILLNLLGGGLFLGAFFMLTDYSFASRRGKILLGLIAGIITASIRIWGGYPEGVCFGILAANCLVGFIESRRKQHVYGVN